MQSNDTQPNKNTEEIDLTQFFRWIGSGFGRLSRGILYGIATIRALFFKNRLFFAGIIILGLALGALYSELLKKEYYKTSMIISCDYLNTQILGNTIEKLNMLAGEQERIGLAEVLRIDTSIASKIRRFDYRPFVSEDDILEIEVLRTQLLNLAPEQKDVIEKFSQKLQIDNKNAYEIIVEVYNPESVKPLESAIVKYFKDNEYIRRRIEINQINLQSKRAKLIRESTKLDSLKSILYENYQQLGKRSRGSNNVILGEDNMTDPLSVYRQDLELYEEILGIDRLLFIRPEFEVLEGFTTYKQPESYGLFKILFISFMISIAMGYLIIAAWKFDNYLAKINTDRS
jgi:hypothetical protein